MGSVTLNLADTSAWHRSSHPEVAGWWERFLVEDSLATCAQARLEILYSAQNLIEYESLAQELTGLHQLPCGSEQFDRALRVQHELARKGGLHHRSVTIADLVIAASAEAAGAIVWHYDTDFDRIAEITGQPTAWIAPRGSL